MKSNKWDELLRELNYATEVRRAAQMQLLAADEAELAAHRQVADALRKRVAAVIECNKGADGWGQVQAAWDAYEAEQSGVPVESELDKAVNAELAAERQVADALQKRVAAVSELNRATDDEQMVLGRILDEWEGC